MFRSSSGGGQKTLLGRLTACKDEAQRQKRHKDTVNYLQRRGEHWTQRQSGGVPSSELTVT